MTLDRCTGGCYIKGAKLMMRALQGNLGGLFSLWPSYSPLLGFVFWLVLGMRAALLLPLVEELSKRGFRILFNPLAELRIVFAQYLDGD